jgi:hypothetical protein
MSNQQWYGITEACHKDNLGRSRKFIEGFRKDGTFKIGVHYRVDSHPNALRPSYSYNVPAIAKLWGVEVFKR